jgi:hypothetical protein
MGAGDWLMCTGQVKDLYAHRGQVVMVVNHVGRLMWHPVFDGNPKITRMHRSNHVKLLNAGGNRPYIAGKNNQRWSWKPYKPIPGELYFTVEEKAFAEPYRGLVMIEPNSKANGHTNKQWLWERWQQLVSIAPMVQCSDKGPWLNGVTMVNTPTFRHACAVLSVCKAYVGPEGGLHHAAAALEVPAVVLWSHFIDPSITGYQTQKNIRHAEGICGMRVNCPKCRESMEAISVDEVAEALRDVLS